MEYCCTAKPSQQLLVKAVLTNNSRSFLNKYMNETTQLMLKTKNKKQTQMMQLVQSAQRQSHPPSETQYQCWPVPHLFICWQQLSNYSPLHQDSTVSRATGTLN